MCLVIPQKSSTKPLEAKRDILVYKVVLFNKKNPDIVISEVRSFKYHRGYHYYQAKDSTVDEHGFRTIHISIYNGVYRYIHEGLHAFLSEKAALKVLEYYTRVSRNNFIIVKMIIPSGAKYYVNKKSGEIVSNEIIFPSKGAIITAKTL